MRRFGAWVVLAILIVYLVFVGGAWFGLYSSAIRLASATLFSVVFATWAVVAWRNPEWRPRSRLVRVIVLVIVSLTISTIASRFPRQSVEYLAYAIVLAALYLLLVRLLASPFFRVRIGMASVALSLVVSSAFIVLCIAHWVKWWGLVGHIAVPPLRPESESLTFGNPSAVMTIALLLLATSVAAVGWQSRARRGLVLLLGFLTAFVVLVSGSRAGWFAVGVAALVSAAAWFAGSERRRMALDLTRERLSARTSRMAVGVLLVAGITVAIALGPAVLRRIGEGGSDLRFAYVAAAMRMFVEAPILGTGPGTWVIQRVRYTRSPETDYYIPHAHDIYAQTLAELGVIGAVVGILLAVQLFALVRPALADPDPTRRRVGWAALFVLVYLAAHQVLDFYMNMPAVLFAAALPIAWLDSTSTSPHKHQALPGWGFLPARLGALPPLVGALVLAVACGGLLWTETAAAKHADAVSAYNAGDWASADAAVIDALASDPDWPPYDFTAGLTADAVGDHQRAADEFRRAAAADDLPEAWLNLAAEEQILGHPSAAITALDHAARLGLQRPAIAIGIASLADHLGYTDLAIRGFSAAVAGAPSLAADPWWQADPVRAEQFPTVIDSAIRATASTDRWQIALMAGDPSRARGLVVTGSHASDSIVPDDVIAAWEGDSAATQRIVALCNRDPLNDVALAWAARIARRQGDRALANRYLNWAFGESSGALEPGSELHVSSHLLLGRSVFGNVAEFYGTYTYRRPTPWNLLVPSVVQLAIG